MSTNTEPPPSLSAVLALRPPLATSTRTDLAPSFKLLRSLVNTVYGSTSARGLEPGLWRAQLSRAAQRAGELIRAVWSKLGGEGGVIVDDEGEGGRGVMRLQGVISDLQIFAGSLASVQDPLSTFLLDSLAFTRTQATVNSLIKKLASLVTHYRVADLITTPITQWPEEDKLDQEEDIATLPVLIAKSRPSKAILRQFEAELISRQQTDADHQDSESSSAPKSVPTSPDPNRHTSSVATQGLSAAKRSEFLRFVYSQNPNLVGSHSLDDAVAVGTAAVSSMSHPGRTASSNTEDSRSTNLGKPSLVQQRISNLVTSSNGAPPLPSGLNLPSASRRIASDSSTTSRKTWTVDMSGLDAVQRRSSGSFSRTQPILPPTPQVSVTAPPVRWKKSSSGSTQPRTSLEDVVPELEKKDVKPVSGFKRDSSAASVSDTSSEDAKAPSIATFAEQAAAIIAARNRRTGNQSTKGSWTKPVSRSGSLLNSATSTLESTPEDAGVKPTSSPKPRPSSQADPPESVKPIRTPTGDLSTSSPLSRSPSNATVPDTTSLSSSPQSVSLTSKSASLPIPHSFSSSPSQADRTLNQHTPMKQTRPAARGSTISATTSARSSVFGSPPPTTAHPPSASPPTSIRPLERPGTALSISNASLFSYTSNHPAISLQPEADFELVTDLIEDHSLLDVIVGPPSPKPDSAPEVDVNSEVEELAWSSPSKTLHSQLAPAPVVEESSLADLLAHATMFESWDSRALVEPERESHVAAEPELTEKFVPRPPSVVTDSTLRNGQASPPVRTPLSPPSTVGSHKVSRKGSVYHPPSPISPRPSTRSLQPGGSPTLDTLRVAEPPSPARSFSGQSWATSLMSAPPVPPDFDLSALSAGRLFRDEPGSEMGWRILCLDGGGIRGLSMLYLVRYMLEGVQKRCRLVARPLPCECFDMICGVGTGGIIALLLGRLRLNIDEAIDAYLSISRKVFGQGKGALSILLGKSRYSASKLEAAMQAVVERAGVESLSDSDGLCRTFVMAMRRSEGAGNAFRTLRSYPTRVTLADRCSVSQAARATSAAPLFFKPVAVDDAALSAVPRSASLNNPSLEAVTEARGLWPDRGIDALVSLGAGRSPDRSGSIGRACGEIADACDNAASAVVATATDEGWLNVYGRYNVEFGTEASGMNEWDLAQVVYEATLRYVECGPVAQRLDRTISLLSDPIFINRSGERRTQKLADRPGGGGPLRLSLSLEALPSQLPVPRADPQAYELSPSRSLKLPELNFD